MSFCIMVVHTCLKYKIIDTYTEFLFCDTTFHVTINYIAFFGAFSTILYENIGTNEST